MKRKSILYRNEFGQFESQSYLDNYHENECWEDHRVKPDNIRFPIHNQYKSGDVHTWNLYDVNEFQK